MPRPAKKEKTMSAHAASIDLVPVLEGFSKANAEQAEDTKRILLSLKQIGADKAIKELETLIDQSNADARRYRLRAEALRKSL